MSEQENLEGTATTEPTEGVATSTGNESILDKGTSTEGEKTAEKGANESGEGEKSPERPEWLPEKYKTPEDFAKGYDEMSKKFGDAGGFDGAPEGDYVFEIADDAGFEIDHDHPTIQSFNEVAREVNMSQDTYSKLMEIYGQDVMFGSVDQEAEIAKLGDNVDLRIDNMNKFIDTSGISDSAQEKIKELTVTAEGFTAVEEIMGLVNPKEVSVNRNEKGEKSTGLSYDDIAALQKNELFTATGAEGRAYRKDISAKWKAFYNE